MFIDSGNSSKVDLGFQEPYSFAPTPKFNSVEIGQAVKQQKGTLIYLDKQKALSLKKEQMKAAYYEAADRQQYKVKKMFQSYERLTIFTCPQDNVIKQTQSVLSVQSKASKQSQKPKRTYRQKHSSSFYSSKLKSSRSNQHLNQVSSPRSVMIKPKGDSSKSLSKTMKVPYTVIKSPSNKHNHHHHKVLQNTSKFNLWTPVKNKILSSPTNSEINKAKKLIPQQSKFFYNLSETKGKDIREKGKSFHGILNKTRPKLTFKTRVFHTTNLEKQANSQMEGMFFQY